MALLLAVQILGCISRQKIFLGLTINFIKIPKVKLELFLEIAILLFFEGIPSVRKLATVLGILNFFARSFGPGCQVNDEISVFLSLPGL